MVRKLAFLAALALVAGPAFYFSLAALTAKTALAEDKKDADQQKTDSGDQQKKDDKAKEADKYLGLDWGDNPKDKEKENPDAAQPTQKADLEKALPELQLKRLQSIKKKVEETEKLVKKAQDVYDGKEKNFKKQDAMKMLDNAALQYHQALKDVEALAKGIEDKDTKLTLLREYGDAYKNKACELYCKEVKIGIELAKNLGELKQAVAYLKRVQQIDKNYPGIEDCRALARAAYERLMAEVEQQKKVSAGTGGNSQEEVKPYDDGRPKQDDYKKTGTEDYKKTGRN